MAVLKVPRINTEQRQAIILEIGEIVYDTDQNTFFGGDSITVGGFIIGESVGGEIERVTPTELNIQSKCVILKKVPLDPENVSITPECGISQVYGVDYIVEGNKIRWDNLGLDGFLDTTDVLIIQY